MDSPTEGPPCAETLTKRYAVAVPDNPRQGGVRGMNAGTTTAYVVMPGP